MKILDKVLEDIQPDREDRKKMEKTSKKIIERAETVCSDFNLDINPKLVGSAARGTWLSKERDIDLFLMFPRETPREKLEEKGLEIGRKISEGRGSEQYAEHPYINTEIEGFDVDIVPCYNIEDPKNLQSAVDRSPHHQKYIESQLSQEQPKEVLLLKKFLKGIGAYGSELAVHGFSGYLCELLIIEYGTFLELIKAASKWGDRKIISPEERSEEELRKVFPEDPLIFIDPVDSSRNVAAAISRKKYATFVRATEAFIENPKAKFFFPEEPPTSKENLREIMGKRKTRLLAVSFEIQFELVQDILYPQLRKTRRALVKQMENADFEVHRTGVWTGGNEAFIILELNVSKLPKVRKHMGPPLGVDANPFLKKHLNSEKKLAGPFLNDEGRLIFELERNNTQAKEFLENLLEKPEGFGKHIEKSIEKDGYEILEDEEVLEARDDTNYLKFLGDYLTRCLPWLR